MKGRFLRLIRDLHLYGGLFASPFVIVFAVSVFYLVHAWWPHVARDSTTVRTVTDLPLPDDLEKLEGRALIDALQPVLAKADVQGEVEFVQRRSKERQLIVPVMVPGRPATVTIDIASREATIERRSTGLGDAFVTLHKAPGPHLANIRMNWFYMWVWGWFADATAYLLLFITVSGVYLWYALRTERKAGGLLLVAGAITFFGIVYALSH